MSSSEGDAPSFSHPYVKEEHLYGYLNGYKNLSCKVEAEPKARFEWLSSPTKVRKTGNVTEFPNESILQLKLEESTFGKYKCKATNRWGKAERVIILEKGVKPEPPQFLELRGANSDLLDLGIKGPDMKKLNVSDNMKPIGYNVMYKPYKQGESQWDNKYFTVSEDNSYVLQHLQHNTEYEIKAAAKNVAGMSEYSDVSIFKTLTAESDTGFKTSSNSFQICTATVIIIVILTIQRL
ncbi:hypothetical protein HHI36_010500 [Cryptolaemus montrouzieri]|uniref:Uncharacterized protein n=1 Tax=Cryptolaemus montrouzieri TaxID=559131 RepID=A0ABD2MJC7_9CUCU